MLWLVGAAALSVLIVILLVGLADVIGTWLHRLQPLVGRTRPST